MDEKGQAETIRPASLVRAPSWRAFPSPHPDQEHAQVAYAPGSSDRDSTKSVPESGQDIEKAAPAPISKVSGDTQEQESSKALRPLQWAAVKLAKWNVETRGIDPVPAEERTHTQYWSVGLLWFSANCNVLSFSTGALAPSLGLGMKDALGTIVGFSALSCLFPAYLSTFGPKLGLRQMVHTRYSFGYFGAGIICLLNAASLMGFSILNCIVGGQTLSAVAGPGGLSDAVGIVVIAIIALVVSFAGIRILHLYERWAFVPVFITFIILVALGGNRLHIPANDPPTSAAAVLAMGGVVAGYLISWGGLASDVTHYLRPDTSSWKLFTVTYFGFFLSATPCLMLGAAFAVSANDIATWSTALETSIGALFDLILAGKVHGFGKFLEVILALSVAGNVTASIYSFGLTFQTMLPFLTPAPRFVWPFFATAIYLPLAIVGASAFYDTLSNFTSVLAYWSALYAAVILVDHIFIRRTSFESYDISAWNDWHRLPWGVAAVGSAALSLGLLVPSISQIWFTGPIAKHSGDLGFELGFAACALLYFPCRLLERRLTGR